MKKTTIKVAILLFTILLSFVLLGIKQIVKLDKIEPKTNTFIIDENNLLYKRDIFNLKNISIIPTKYDLRDYITIGVEAQGELNICYAYAALTSVETYISRYYDEYKNNPKDFSEIDLAVNSAQGSSGFFDTTYINYFKKGYGPVDESAKVVYNDSNIISKKIMSHIRQYTNIVPIKIALHRVSIIQ